MGNGMPVFEVIVHIHNITWDDPRLRDMVMMLLRKMYGLHTLVPDELDVKIYFFSDSIKKKILENKISDKIHDVISIIRFFNPRFDCISVSSWCNGDDSFCKPYKDAFKTVKEKISNLKEFCKA